MENICRNCKQPNSSEAKFCRFCAASLANEARARSSSSSSDFQNRFGASQAASSRALAALWLTVISVVLCCFLTSVPAAFLGWQEIEAIKRDEAPPSGLTFAQIGLWGGIALTILSLIGNVLIGLWFLASIAGGY